MDLRDELKSTLGNGFTVERELTGGGMSRVFIARDTTLGRDVVVKVLPPDMSAGVSAERFRREIGKYVSKEEVARLERFVTIGK